MLALSCMALAGCKPKYQSAAENRFRDAAEKGNAHAQLNLSACYFTGRGVEKDLALSRIVSRDDG